MSKISSTRFTLKLCTPPHTFAWYMNKKSS